MCVCLSSPVSLHIFGVRSGICQYSVVVMVQYSYEVWLQRRYSLRELSGVGHILRTLVMYRSSDKNPSLRLNDTVFFRILITFL